MSRKMTMAWGVAFEGCISLNKSYRSKGYGLQYLPSIALNGCDKELLLRWGKLVGYGHCYLHRKYHNAWKDLYQWRIASNIEIKKFLKEIIPYLPSKIEQAKILLEFVEKRLKKEWKKKKINFSKKQCTWDEEDEIFYIKMKELNKRGKPKISKNNYCEIKDICDSEKGEEIYSAEYQRESYQEKE